MRQKLPTVAEIILFLITVQSIGWAVYFFHNSQPVHGMLGIAIAWAGACTGHIVFNQRKHENGSQLEQEFSER